MGQSQVMPQGSERRRTKRLPHNSKLEIEWGSATLDGKVVDISSEGMFIETADPLWVGASFGAVWMLDEPARLECTVKRVEPGRGMGVAYTVANPEEKQRVAALLEALDRQ